MQENALSLPGPPPTLAVDTAFAALLQPGAPLRRLADGCGWAEGPVWLAASKSLLWSDVTGNRELRWSEAGGVEVFRAPSNFANGHALDAQARLVTCEHGTRSVVRTEPDGRRTVLADRFEGRRLNSPNDVVVARDGSVWFTDPSYGIEFENEGYPGEREYGGCHVFRLDAPGQDLQVVSTAFVQPNGLALSLDERVLYVVDTGATHVPGGPRSITALALDDRRRAGPLLWTHTMDAGSPDGIALDEDGRLWAGAGDGVHCLSPQGRLLGKLLLSERAANLCFGGPDGRTLFITATTSLYALDLAVRGATG